MNAVQWLAITETGCISLLSSTHRHSEKFLSSAKTAGLLKVSPELSCIDELIVTSNAAGQLVCQNGQMMSRCSELLSGIRLFFFNSGAKFAELHINDSLSQNLWSLATASPNQTHKTAWSPLTYIFSLFCSAEISYPNCKQVHLTCTLRFKEIFF